MGFFPTGLCGPWDLEQLQRPQTPWAEVGCIIGGGRIEMWLRLTDKVLMKGPPNSGRASSALLGDQEGRIKPKQNAHSLSFFF